jgi:diazepam-binding inhibitor (GABA receptor modulator, acyl-CoA-binding protein)
MDHNVVSFKVEGSVASFSTKIDGAVERSRPLVQIEEDFQKVVRKVARVDREDRERWTQEQLLALYAWYKQATAGDAKGHRPSMFDLKGCAKFDAWWAVRGTSMHEAMLEYIIQAAQLFS